MWWKSIMGSVAFGFSAVRYLLFNSNHLGWYTIVGIVTGAAAIVSLIRLGHLLGLWPFTIG